MNIKANFNPSTNEYTVETMEGIHHFDSFLSAKLFIESLNPEPAHANDNRRHSCSVH